jgi:protein TonB
MLFLNKQQQAPTHSKPMLLVQLESVKKPTPNSKIDARFQKQIVQSNQGLLAKQAAPDAFLGEKTRLVERQTVSSRKMIVAGKEARTKQSRKIVKHTQNPNQATPQGKVTGTAVKILSKLGLGILPEQRRVGAARSLASDEPQWANVGVQPQDYVVGIKASDRTALNTKEYQYFGYHQRIRSRLELEWNRLLRETVERFYRSGRRLASDMEYTTRLLVILNARGEITRVTVLGVSGTQELDDVAVQAFNRAGPFPNPPQGLVQNGEIEVPWEMKLRS